LYALYNEGMSLGFCCDLRKAFLPITFIKNAANVELGLMLPSIIQSYGRTQRLK